MMPEMIEVDTGILKGDIEKLENALGVIRIKMDVMYTAVEELNTMWEGPANQMLNLQFQKDREMMAELCDVLKNLTESMKFARSEYGKCEEQVRNTVNSIQI